MINHKLIMPDGSLIFSNSIVSFSLTESVNDSVDISLGSACSAKIDVKIRPKNRLTWPQYGDKIKLYEAQDDGPYEQRGVFFVESCEKESAKSFHLTAYDGVSKLSADVSGKINEIPQWPVTVYSLLKMSVEACGLALADASIPNGDRLVNKFSYGGVTARKVCKWAGEVSGRFCRATPDGKIAFRWYEDFTGTLSNRIQTYYMNGFSRKPYSVEKIERVQIKATDSDIGTSYPSTQGDKNTYAISGNPFLMADSVDDLRPIAQYLYGILSKVSYVPATLEMPSKLSVKVGGIYRVLVPAENDQTIYVMSKTESNFRDRIESTGSQKRGTASHVAGSKLEVFEGKLFEYRRDINGMELRVQASEVSSKEAVKKVNELSATVDGYTGRISAVEQSSKQATDKVNELSVTVGGFDGRISSAETTANGASQKVAELSADTDAIKLSLKSTQIGGDNLLPGSADMKGYNADSGGLDTKPVLSYGKDGSVTVTNNGSNVTIYMRARNIIVGRKYVFSILFKQLSGDNTVNFTWLGRNDTGGYPQSEIYHLPGGTVGSKTANVTDMGDGWKKVWFVIRPTAAGITWMQLYPRAAAYEKPTTNKFILLHPMLEEGTIPSAWTEAQGDITKAAEAKLEVSLGEIRSTVSSAEKTASDAKTAADDAALQAGNANKSVSELSQTVNGFETRVSQAETTANGAKEAASSAKQTADSVSAEVSGKVDSEAGDWTTFGWHLTRDQWSVYSGGHTVLGVTDAGAELDGKITARSGSIGGWGIDGSSIFYEDTANDKSLVMSINGGLYGGTGDREWHIRQNGAALFRSAEVYGDIYANNGYFKGTVYANRISYGGDSGYVSGKCLSNNSVTTTETSTGINDSLGYANFSDDVFHERATAPAIKATAVFCSNYWSGKHLLKERSATIGGQTINYMSWT